MRPGCDEIVLREGAAQGSRIGECAARPLGVLHLIAYGNLAGTEMSVARLARSQLARGLRPIVAILYGGGPIERILEQDGTPVVRVGATKRQVARVWPRLVELIRTTKPDVVHAHDLRWWSAILGRAVHRGPHLLTIHNQMVVGRGAWRWRLKYQIARRSYNFFAAVSGAALRSVTKVVTLPPERCAVIPNGIPVETFQARPSRSACKAKYGCDPNKPVVGFVGRLSPEKGVDEFLRTCGKIVQLEPGVQFWIIGDGEESGACVALAKGLGLDSHVTFWGSRPDAVEMLFAMDALLTTSRRESFGLVLLEAMAAEVPVLGFVPLEGGTREVVRIPETALLLPERDPARLAALVANTLRNPTLQTSLTSAARDHVRRHFDLSLMTDRYLQLYVRLLNERGWPSARGYHAR